VSQSSTQALPARNYLFLLLRLAASCCLDEDEVKDAALHRTRDSHSRRELHYKLRLEKVIAGDVVGVMRVILEIELGDEPGITDCLNQNVDVRRTPQLRASVEIVAGPQTVEAVLAVFVCHDAAAIKLLGGGDVHRIADGILVVERQANEQHMV